MKTIKKVKITTLPVVNGSIIDSFNAEIDKTTNAPSINAVETKLSEFKNEIDVPVILYGINVPLNSIGENGNIFIQYF